MAGQLDGTLSGRPVQIVAAEKLITLRFPSLRDAWSVRSAGSPQVKPATDLLRRLGFSLRIEIGDRIALSVLPQPALPVRILAPWLAE